MKSILLNVGYYNVKEFNNGQLNTYQTRIQVNPYAKTNYISLNGTKYEVGEGMRSIERRDENFVHLVCTYYSIAKQCKDGEHVKLYAALPMKQYLNDMFRQQYVESIRKTNGLLCEVDGVTKKIYIDDVICYMEGASAVLANPQHFVGKVCGLIDIGGNDVNAAIFNNCKLLSDTITPLGLGTIKIEKQFVDNVNVLNGWDIQDYEIQYLLKSDDIVVRKNLEESYNGAIKNLKNKLIEKKWSLGSLPLFFTGGGSLLLTKYIKQNFENFTISKTPLFDNLQGLSVVQQEVDESDQEHINSESKSK